MSDIRSIMLVSVYYFEHIIHLMFNYYLGLDGLLAASTLCTSIFIVCAEATYTSDILFLFMNAMLSSLQHIIYMYSEHW
jgi:hypothetical protein